MSDRDMWQEISIEFPEPVADPDQVGATLLVLWNHHTEGWPIDADGRGEWGWEGSAGFDGARGHVSYGSRWQTPGLHALAEAASARYPEATVHLSEEWQGDGGPTIRHERWEGGRLVAARDSDGPLVPVDAEGRGPAEQLDELRGAIRDLADGWGQIGVGEDFWEHFTRTDAEQLARVLTLAGLPQAAEEVRAKCAEADPEAWAEVEAEEYAEDEDEAEVAGF